MLDLFRLSFPHPFDFYKYIRDDVVDNDKVNALLYLLAQLAPFLILLGLPALALLARAHWASFVRFVFMVLESLFAIAIPLPWAWGGNASGSGADGGNDAKREDRRRRRKEKEKEKEARSALRDVSDKESEFEEEDDSDLYYPGLVNISGTYCFLNSVLQATASLAYLQPYLDVIHSRAVDLDVPTPVVDTLQETLQTLNTPKTSRSSLRPVPIINALSQPAPGTRGRSKLFASREHQDAQELFQLLSECIKSEAQAVDAEAQRDRGLGAFASSFSSSSSLAENHNNGSAINGGEMELSASGVFDGLTANRRSCVACGYTEAVMHFAFATWSLALPSSLGAGGSCSLQECLAEYTRLELLTDCVCRRCSMRATHVRLREDAERLAEATKPGGAASGSQYKKKKVREARRMERLVAALIEEGRIEEDVKGLVMERIVSAASTKQAMIARPPKVLVLHLNRSLHFGSFSSPSRNPIRVRFPEILDLTPFTTSGQLSTAPSSPISTPPPPLRPSGAGAMGTMVPRSTTPTQGMYDHPRVLYRLSAVVVHYGAHSFGHYVCFRRKPRGGAKAGKGKGKGEQARAGLTVPQMPCPFGCDCKMCMTYGPVRDVDSTSTSSSSSSSSTFPSYQSNPDGQTQARTYRPPKPGKGWLRISDDAVEEVGLERVLAEGSGAFLLFYERVQSAWGPRSLHSSVVAGASAPVGAGMMGMGMGLGKSALDGVGVGFGVGLGEGGGRGIGSIYQHLKVHETPRSSEETVRPADVLVGGEETSASSSVSSSLSSSEGGFGERVRPRVVRRTMAGRRERGKEREEGKGKEKESSNEAGGTHSSSSPAKSVDADGELPSEEVRNGEGEENKSIPNGSAIPSSLTNGFAIRGTDGDAHEDAHSDGEGDGLSDSIVKVELPSPPRSRSASPVLPSSPPNSTSTASTTSTTTKSTLKPKPKQPPLAPLSSPSPPPSPTSAASPGAGAGAGSPGRKRKGAKAKSRIPRVRAGASLSTSASSSTNSPSTSTNPKSAPVPIPRSASSSSSKPSQNANVSPSPSPSPSPSSSSSRHAGMLMDRATVGLRA